MSPTSTTPRTTTRTGPGLGGRVVAWVAVVTYVAALAFLTLTPLPDAVDGRSANLVPGASFARYGAEGVDPALALRQLGGNLAMFLPLGFLLPFAARTARRFLVLLPIAIVTSAGIEVTQAVGVEGRVFDIDDVLLNVVGAAIGLVLHRVVTRRS